jgi:hypothetical protein
MYRLSQRSLLNKKRITAKEERIMASGKQIGEVSFKATSITIIPGPAGSVLSQGNFEGTGVAGAQSATILATATFVGGKSGTYSTCSLAYRDDGEVIRVNGSGDWESIGKHRWRTQGFIESSEGDTRVTEGEIDLVTRSWIVKVFEKIG